ncbi:flavin reductase family protein [Rhodococcoides fascians]|uniref:flavin reductase family protein n=1 Tax=Rhodococcoides fascians TaxID=1828 RepID=UPI001DF0EFAD|nr:flavin reductase family protein [Rhodococcus fascians]CAH0245514.1 4-nitrophenol 4-monooxygenase/4-nitrocatechol 2-monooxygenase, reductase component [Rhodococcus fascians]
MSQSKHPAAAGALDQGVFRNVAGHFTSGVTIITTESDSRLFGTTVSAVASLSMDPPMMLVCLNKSSSTHDAVRERGRFAVNILALEQRDFAGRFATKGADKFRDVPVVRSERGLPLIEGALASIECRVVNAVPGGTHTVFIGEVLDARSRPGEPLTYFRGQFGSLERVL